MPALKHWRIRAEEYMKKLNGKARRLKHYRCGHCRARKNLAKELWQYIQPPQCQKCGRRDWRLDYHRHLEKKNGTGVFESCQCYGYPYPHRIGSGIQCVNHPTGYIPAQYDKDQYYG